MKTLNITSKINKASECYNKADMHMNNAFIIMVALAENINNLQLLTAKVIK